ncbi:hypothetical protein [Ruminococcus flavefaciens]|uniref:hypothetical protein n=1 Tax=Ruminococcus flavefaciens TaxID=1265 RepID=UPI0026ED0277|nr:hypothetical protein [Ruminococcus flavefaciens]
MNDLQNELLSIIRDRLKIKINDTAEDITEKNIFGHEVNFIPLDMVYFMLIIEKKYGIRFTEEDFDSPEFYTIKGISGIIAARMNA